MIHQFSVLPEEIIRHILDYDSSIRYRNGKYVDRIPHYDPRFKTLESVPQKLKTYLTMSPTGQLLSRETQGMSIYICFENRDHLMVVQKYPYGNYIHYEFINRGDIHNIQITEFKMVLYTGEHLNPDA
jgi:hypothetical protein